MATSISDHGRTLEGRSLEEVRYKLDSDSVSISTFQLVGELSPSLWVPRPQKRANYVQPELVHEDWFS